MLIYVTICRFDPGKVSHEMKTDLRSIETTYALPGIQRGSRGYFHKWCDQPFYDSNLDYPIRKTYALVELIDGRVKLFDPELVKFLEPLKKY